MTRHDRVESHAPDVLLRCVPFTDAEIEAAIQRHEDSECEGGCLSAAAGREALRLRHVERVTD